MYFAGSDRKHSFHCLRYWNMSGLPRKNHRGKGFGLGGFPHEHAENLYGNSELSFWQTERDPLLLRERFPGYNTTTVKAALKASQLWKKLGCPYEQALTLFEGTESDKKMALQIFQKLGAFTVAEKLKQEIRISGIKSIPHGLRKTTRSNPVRLTNRELNVLEFLKEGMQSKEIASGLFISVKTVDHHISSILFKLDVNSRVKAVKKAVDMGILT